MVDGSGFDRQQPKKNAGQDQPAPQADPVADTVKSINNFFGQLRNDAVSSVTGFDAKTLVTKLPPENIASYLRGKDIKESNAENLSQQQHNDLKVYNALHDNLSAQIPFFDHDAFVKSMEQEIQQRAQNQKSTNQPLGTTSNTSPSGDKIKQDTTNALSSGHDQASIHSQAQSLLESSQKALLDEAQASRQAASQNSRSLEGHPLSAGPTTEFGSQKSTPITWDAVVAQSGNKSTSSEIQPTVTPARSEHSQSSDSVSTHSISTSSVDSLPKSVSSEKHLDAPLSISTPTIESKSNIAARNDESHSVGNANAQPASAQEINAKTNKFDPANPSNLESSRTTESKPTRRDSATGSQITSNQESLPPLPVTDSNSKPTKFDTASPSKSDSLQASDSITSRADKPQSSNLLSINPIGPKTGYGQEAKLDISNQSKASSSQSGDSHSSQQPKPDSSDVSVGARSASPSSGREGTPTLSKSDLANQSNVLHQAMSHQTKFDSTNARELGTTPQKHANPQGTISDFSNQAIVSHASKADLRATRSDSSNVLGNAGIPGAGSSKGIDGTKSPSSNQSSSESARTKPDTHRQNNSNSDTSRANHSDAVRNVRWQFSRSPDRGQSESATRPNTSAQFVRSGGIVSDGPNGPEKVVPKGVFTTSQYIQDKRYIFGAEIALAAVIAAAGAARLRADAVKPGPRAELIPGDKPREDASRRVTIPPLQADYTIKSAPKPERVPTGAPTIDDSKPMQSPVETITVRDTIAGKQIPQNFVASRQIPEKRFITGTEIALAAIIASVGSSRIRADLVGPRSSGSRVHPDCGPTPEATSANLTEKKSDQSANGNPSNNQPMEESTTIYPGSDDSPTQRTQPTALRAKNPQSNREDSQDRSLTKEEPPKNKLGSSENRYLRTTIRPKILISATDTLVSIAEAFFHDPNLAWLIADLNSAVLKESWVDGKRIIEMKMRQQIELPVWDDVSEFYRTRSVDTELENLITIVDQSSIDIELLNSTLGKIVDPHKDTPE